VAGAATANAGLLQHRGNAIVVNRKAFSENHLNSHCALRDGETGFDIIDAALRPRRKIA
jgi:hypothetical protein